MVTKCTKCDWYINTRNEPYVKCSKSCKGHFHILYCVNIDIDSFEKLKKQGKLRSWCCEFCSLIVDTQLESGSTDNSTSCLVNMEILTGLIESAIRPLTAQICELESKIDNLSRENASLHIEVQKLVPTWHRIDLTLIILILLLSSW